jgi:chitinase
VRATTPVKTTPPTKTTPPDSGAAPLTATYSQDSRSGPNGFTHVSGYIEVTNPGRQPAQGWQVSLRIPGGNQVSSDGSVDVTQNTNRVTFTPYDDQLPPGASASFSFTVSGVLSALPTGCTINGQACD